MQNRAIKHSLIFIFSAILVFQLLLFVGIIPYKYTWGGKLESKEQAMTMISVSIFVNILFLVTILIKTNYLKLKIPPIILKIILWLMVIVFGLNTIGNLFAEQDLEKYLATPITLILCILCGRVAMEKQEN